MNKGFYNLSTTISIPSYNWLVGEKYAIISYDGLGIVYIKEYEITFSSYDLFNTVQFHNDLLLFLSKLWGHNIQYYINTCLTGEETPSYLEIIIE